MNGLSIFLVSNNQIYADSLATIIVNEGPHQVFQFNEEDDFWRHITLGPDLIVVELSSINVAKSFSRVSGRKKSIPFLIICNDGHKINNIKGLSKTKNRVLQKGEFSNAQFYEAVLELTQQYSFKERFKQILKRKSG